MITRRLFVGAIAAVPVSVTLKPSRSVAGGIGEKPEDKALGDPNAPVTIIEYFSLTCPHCRWFHESIFPRLKTDYIDTGKVRFVARDFPLNTPALHAAVLAHCAGDERYFAFIHMLFETFDDWTTSRNYLDALVWLGKLGGLSRKRFEACLADKALEEKILSSIADARTQYGVNSTPTVIVNGIQYVGEMRFEALAEHLESLVSGS